MSKIDETLITLIKERTAQGKQEYGQTLDDNPAQMLERLQHLLEEQIDAAKYTIWIMNKIKEEMNKDAGG